MFYLNSIEQLENLVGLKEQLEVCLTCSRLLAAIQVLLLHQKLRCDSNKITLLNKSWSQPTLVQDPGPSNQLTASPCRDSGELNQRRWAGLIGPQLTTVVVLTRRNAGHLT